MFEYLDGLDDLIYRALADAHRVAHPDATSMQVYIAVTAQQTHLTVQDALAILNDSTTAATLSKAA